MCKCGVTHGVKGWQTDTQHKVNRFNGTIARITVVMERILQGLFVQQSHTMINRGFLNAVHDIDDQGSPQTPFCLLSVK